MGGAWAAASPLMPVVGGALGCGWRLGAVGGDGAATARRTSVDVGALVVGGGVELLAATGRQPRIHACHRKGLYGGGRRRGKGGDGAAAARVAPAAGEALMEGGGVELLAGRGGRRTRHACRWGGLVGGGRRGAVGGTRRPPHASRLSLGRP